MKKYLICAAVLASLVLFSGCFGKTDEEEISELPVNDEYTADTETEDLKTEDTEELIGKQIDIIASSKDIYQDVILETEYNYAVTDLDENGRLEIIIASQQGSGFYTYADFYEVSENFDTLEKCVYDIEKNDSQPDIIQDTVRYCHTNFGGVQKIIYDFDDYIRAGAEYQYTTKNMVSLNDGTVSVFTYGVLSKETDEIRYFDSDNNEISKEDYDQLCADPFGDNVVQEEKIFGWKKLDLEMTEENLKKDLKESYDIFAGRKNQDVIKWFDEYADKNYPDNIADFKTGAYPDTVFKCDGNNVYAEKDGETQFLYSGMPIWNVYFADLTGDGKPELCSGISYGSGIIDEHIVVFDYVNQ